MSKIYYKKFKRSFYILKTVNKDMTAYNRFIWPEAGYVKCPDWKPTQVCGNGFHGALNGEGDGSLFNWADDAKWLVLECGNYINLSGKVKFPSCNVLYAGSQEKAIKLLRKKAGNKNFIGNILSGELFFQAAGGHSSQLSGGYHTQLSGGNSSQLSGGHSSQLAGGNFSQLSSGDSSQLSGGFHSQLAGGDYSRLSGGNHSQLSGGHSSQLAGGNFSQLSSGDSSQLSGGFHSQLAGGDYSRLSGGHSSQLSSGDSSQLVGGNYSQLSGGEFSSMMIKGNCGKFKIIKNTVIMFTWRENDTLKTAVFYSNDFAEKYQNKWAIVEAGKIIKIKDNLE